MSGSIVALIIALVLAAFVYFNRIGRTISAREDGASNAATGTNQRAAREREKVIRDYGAFIERNPSLPTRIEDVAVLPHSRETILDALMLEIARGHSQRMDGVMANGALWLAQYQPGVGNEPLEKLGIDVGATLTPRDQEGMRALVERMVAAQEKTGPRFDEFSKLVKADIERITRLIAAARMLAQRMPEQQKQRVLGSRSW